MPSQPVLKQKIIVIYPEKKMDLQLWSFNMLNSWDSFQKCLLLKQFIILQEILLGSWEEKETVLGIEERKNSILMLRVIQTSKNME